MFPNNAGKQDLYKIFTRSLQAHKGWEMYHSQGGGGGGVEGGGRVFPQRKRGEAKVEWKIHTYPGLKAEHICVALIREYSWVVSGTSFSNLQ